jgi:uncharacterized protein YkwD
MKDGFFLKILLGGAALAVVLKILLLAAIFLSPKISPVVPADSSISSQKLIKLTNDYRRQFGLAPLTPNVRLTQAAVNKARDLLTRQYFGHTSPSGQRFSSWIKEVNYNYFFVGENLAIDFKTNQEILDAWINSPGHRDNILKPQYQEIGLAAVPGKFKNHSTVVVVQLFGTRVLGEYSAADNSSLPGNLTDNYFLPVSHQRQLLEIKNLEKINRGLNYFLVVVLSAAIIGYRPRKRINHINIKQPIINRYQAKIFRE